MTLYPLFLKLSSINCLVIGGGAVAERKIERLLESNAIVTVISPEITEVLEKLGNEGKIKYVKRNYQQGDLDGFFLVIASTDSLPVNKEIYEEASKKSILINSVDDVENCNFYLPSILTRGDLQIAISTSGKSPYFAKKLRKHLEKFFYHGLDNDLLQLNELRCKIIEETGGDQELKEKRFKEVLDLKINKILERIEKK